MRNINKLLQLVLDKYKEPTNNTFTGLCTVFRTLQLEGTISVKDHTSLEDFLRDYSPLNKFTNEHYPYAWDRKDRESRIRWLEKHIN